jgi:hypothetical protein
MKINKAVCILSVLGLGAVACSSDDPPASVSCDFAGDMCFTGPISASQCTQYNGTVIASCPSGALLTCPVTQGGQKGTMYFYDQTTVDGMKTINASDPCATFSTSG